MMTSTSPHAGRYWLCSPCFAAAFLFFPSTCRCFPPSLVRLPLLIPVSLVRPGRMLCRLLGVLLLVSHCHLVLGGVLAPLSLPALFSPALRPRPLSAPRESAIASCPVPALLRSHTRRPVVVYATLVSPICLTPTRHSPLSTAFRSHTHVHTILAHCPARLSHTLLVRLRRGSLSCVLSLYSLFYSTFDFIPFVSTSPSTHYFTRLAHALGRFQLSCLDQNSCRVQLVVCVSHISLGSGFVVIARRVHTYHAHEFVSRAPVWSPVCHAVSFVSWHVTFCLGFSPQSAVFVAAFATSLWSSVVLFHYY